MFATWKGPAMVVEKLSPYSYVVDLDGTHYHLHANHLKPFYAEVDEVQIDGYGFGNPNSLGSDSVDTSLCVIGEHDESCDDVNIIDDVSVSMCALIRDEDTKFGDVSSCRSPTEVLLMPSQRLHEMDLSHFTNDEQQQLLIILDK